MKQNNQTAEGNMDSHNSQYTTDDQARFFLASIVDSLQDSIVSVNLEGVITSWNKGAERLYGYPAREAIGRSVSMVTFPDDFKELLVKIDRIRTGEQVGLYDTFRVKKDGQHRHIEVTLSPVKNQDGRVIGVSTVARDVTDLRKIQEALSHSESRLRAIIEAAVDFAIVTLDPDGLIIDWNKGAEVMFGYGREEVIGQHTSIIFTPEDNHGNIPATEIHVAKTEGRSQDERWHLRKDGSRFFMSGVMTPILQPDIFGYVKVGRNITDRKLAEEALFLSEQQKSLAIQSAEMAEWEWDLLNNEAKIGDKVYTMFGLPIGPHTTKADDFFAKIHPDDLNMFRQQIEKAVAGDHIFQAEYRIVRADNSEIKWLNAYGRVVAEHENRPSKMIGVVYDITSRKLLEKQKDDFISMASHELKTPVTAIKAYSELLQENFLDSVTEGNAVLLDKLNGQVNRLIKLLQALLDTSHLSEGRITLHWSTFDLNEEIEKRIPEFESLTRRHRLVWKPANIGMVSADRDRINQVVTNFVSNAAKYSLPNTDIIISTEDKLDHVIVKVQDKGIGIPPEARPFIFDRYYRVRNKDYTKAEGFGLGLYICSEIIKEHHGTIGLESIPGEGSIFYFTLLYK